MGALDRCGAVGGSAREALKAIEIDRGNEAVVGVGERDVALDLGAGGLGQVFIEGDAVDVVGEILGDAGHACFRGYIFASVGDDVGAALVDQGWGGGSGDGLFDAAIEQGIPADGQGVEAGTAIAKAAGGREAALAPVFGTYGEVHAAIDDPVDFVADDQAFDAGVFAAGEQESAFAAGFVEVSGDEGQVEERNAPEFEDAVVGGGFAVGDNDGARDQLPVGFGQTA